MMKFWIIILVCLAGCTTVQEYSTCESWDELVAGDSFQYVSPVRVSDPGTKERPSYTGFWFYDEQQFDITGRYALGMKVYFQDRDVEPSDLGDIGYFDLYDGSKWKKIGETTAWNWQQGCRLQWRPNSDEILWNDRSDDGTHFICRVYNFKTGEFEFLISLDRMAEIAFPQGYTGETNLYFFREGWNPSGTRFIAFLRNMDSPDRHVSGWSISADGQDVRYFFDNTLLEGRYFGLFNDDGSGKMVQKLAEVKANIDPTILPEPYDDWILGDTYVLDGCSIYLCFIDLPAFSFLWRD